MKNIYIPIVLLLIQIGCSGSKEAWDNARRLDSVYSYKKFLEEYPNSDYSEEARNLIARLNEKVAWEKARYIDRISSYEEFIILYPQSELKNTALERINEIKIDCLWEETKIQDTIESYNNFINKYPLSKYVEIAKLKIKESEEIKPLWDQVVKDNTLEKYREFLQKYPTSSYSQLAKNKILEFEKLDWEITKNKNTITGYKTFLERHPTSNYRNLAESKIVDLEVKKIFESEHGYLPPSTKTKSYIDRGYSVMNIHNNTKYDLILRYSGNESFRIVFKPQEKSAIELLNGNYQITASVNAKNVIKYAGTEEIKGGDYAVVFYIIQSFSKNNDTKRQYVDIGEIPSYPIIRKVDTNFK